LLRRQDQSLDKRVGKKKIFARAQLSGKKKPEIPGKGCAIEEEEAGELWGLKRRYRVTGGKIRHKETTGGGAPQACI